MAVSPRYALAPTHLAGDTFGWQLTRYGRFLDCHETFVADNFDRDVEAAMGWAEQIIGTRQDWRHTREGGLERWLATDKRTTAGADVLRPLEPGTLVVAVGPGASGKSTFAAEAGIVTVVCLDSLRERIGGSAGDQSVTPAAVIEQNILLERYLGEGTTVYVDSTNVEVHVRAGLVERARRHHRPTVALRFLPHLDTCRALNRMRPDNRQVPDDVLTWQHALACASTPAALLAEGFTAVHDIVTPF
ncbi:ATP-binding protein [Streptomyces justiciae]|uniref:ATP-binding protein n=1 Tax=Streptomyces justiciae TaxID=2780140 RepID=UPI002117EC4F|nr:ATP-binding protein [Streptomyces justiciae]MCW8383978.1 ATP-binding protein [Streptomyces justiciae]